MLGWNKKVVNLGKPTSLERLGLWGYKGASDLSEFSGMDKLKELTLAQSSIVSLEGLNNKAPIESIKLTSCRKENSIRGIEKFSKLKVIDWDSCAIPGIEPLRYATNLESIGIHNGKKIRSLSPLKDLKKLRVVFMTGNTEIIDGDMTPMIGRRDAFIPPRKHYSHSHKEIDKLNWTVREKNTFEI